MKLCVNFNRLTENQTRKLISLFETMCIAGDIGCSRTLLVDCDGDGNFRPIVQYNVTSDDLIVRRSEPIYKHEILDLLKTGKDILFTDETFLIKS